VPVVALLDPPPHDAVSAKSLLAGRKTRVGVVVVPVVAFFLAGPHSAVSAHRAPTRRETRVRVVVVAVVALLAFVLDAVSAGDGRALSVDTERVTRLGDDFDEVVGACVPDLVNAMARAARATHTLGRNRNTLGGRVETNLGLAARNAADPFSRLASQDLTPGDLGTRDRSFFAFGLGFGCSALACRT